MATFTTSTFVFYNFQFYALKRPMSKTNGSH